MANTTPFEWYGRFRSQIKLGALVALGVGLVTVVAGGAIYLISPDLRAAARTLLVIGAVILSLSAVGGAPEIREALIARRGRYGVNAFVVVAAFSAIIVVLNIISVRNHYRFDATATKQFTLSPQTIKILKELEEPIGAIGFFTPRNPGKSHAESLLREYSQHTKKLQYSFIDPEAEPGIARQYSVKDFPSLVFTSGDRQHRTQRVNEQTFTTALLIVTGKERKVVYFSTGHDERDPFKGEDVGFSYAAMGLLGHNYRVDPLSMAVEEKIPEDAAVVVVAGPKKELLRAERKALEDYLLRGGNVLFLLDPKTPSSYVEILANWGIGLDDGLVVDEFSNAISDSTTPAVQREQYFPMEITAELDVAFFPQATSLKILLDPEDEDTPDSLAVVPLAQTTFQSWLDIGEKTTEPTFEQGVDIRGPHFLGAVIAGTTPLNDRHRKVDPLIAPTRVVVWGDSDFATNRYFFSLSNQDLFLNSVNWLAGDVELIAIRPKPIPVRLLAVTKREFNWILYSSMALLPLVVAVYGGVSWWRRR